MQTFRFAPVHLLLFLLVLSPWASASPAASSKTHSVTLGPARKVPYTAPDSTQKVPAGDAAMLKVRPLFVDAKQKEWTTGDLHEVTDRSFTVRRALRINDALPGEATARWVWQPGPWLLVDRVTGHITALHLPDFDPMVSEVAWFRDYAAYCGVATTAKGGLYAVVAQLGARKAVLHKQLGRWPPVPGQAGLPCQSSVWQREPMRVTMQMAGGEATTYDVVGSASIVEDGDGEEP